MIACTLSREEAPAQRERYRSVGEAVVAAELHGTRLAVRLDDSVDAAVLDELIEVERRCCPFFEIRRDERRKLLEVAVGDAEQLPMLEMVAEALGGT
jgi:hypothetical protein